MLDCVIREADDALTRPSFVSASRMPSSHFRLRREFVEIFRERFLNSMAERSSATPFALK